MSLKRKRTTKDDEKKLSGRSIEVVVGGQKKIFSVHEKLIRASSSFFDKAMSGIWLESSERTIILPDDEPAIFAIYIHWLYTGTFPGLYDKEGFGGDLDYHKLVDAHILGDKLLDIKFQNAAIDAIVEKSATKRQDGKSQHHHILVIDYAFSHSKEKTGIREVFVDIYVRHARSSWFHGEPVSGCDPQSFLYGVAMKLLDRPQVSKTKIDASKYHVHGPNDETAKIDKDES